MKVKNINSYFSKEKLFSVVLLFSIVFIQELEAQAKKKVESECLKSSLDSVLVRIIYKAEQKVHKKKDHAIIVDTMALDVGQNWSVYYDFYKNHRDSIAKVDFINNAPKRIEFSYDQDALQERIDANREIIDVVDRKGESMQIFKDRHKRKLFIFDQGPLYEDTDKYTKFSFFKLVDNVPPQIWKIHEDTINVLGYPCQFATADFRGRSYKAWFTLDIPIGDGPWKFYGLPGIILKVEDTNGIFNFKAIGLQVPTNSRINFPSDRKIVPCESLMKLKKYRKNRYKTISIGFSDGKGGAIYFTTKNPVTRTEMEIGE